MRKGFSKFVSVALAGALSLSCAVFASAEEAKVTYGDVNADGIINSSDALDVLRGAVGSLTLDEVAFTAADVNADGILNSSDALLVLQYSVGSLESFPAEETAKIPAPTTLEGIIALYQSAVSSTRVAQPAYKINQTVKVTDADFSGSAMLLVPAEEKEAMIKDIMREEVYQNIVPGGTVSSTSNLPVVGSVKNMSDLNSVDFETLDDGNYRIVLTFKNEKSPKAGSTIVSMFNVPDMKTYESTMDEQMGVADTEGITFSLDSMEYKNCKITCVVDSETGKLVSYESTIDMSSKIKTVIALFDMVTDTTTRSTLKYSNFIYE